jgi:hypothetical protein
MGRAHDKSANVHSEHGTFKGEGFGGRWVDEGKKRGKVYFPSPFFVSLFYLLSCGLLFYVRFDYEMNEYDA